MKNQKMLDDTLEAINHENDTTCRNKIRSLVNLILQKQQDIGVLTKDVTELKAELKELSQPTRVTLKV